MRKKFLSILFIFIIAFFLIGCSSSKEPNNKEGITNNDGLDSDYSIIISDSNRKIIYTSYINIETKNLTETVEEIKKLLEEGDWIQSENLTSNTSYIIFRIKTTRLNNFITSLQTNYETTSFRLESNDVSKDYFDTSAKILTLEKEQARLIEMYDGASIEEMIYINRRLSEIETDLLRFNRELNEFDSLVDFSTVYVYIYGPKASPTPPSYKKTLKNSFLGGWNAVVLVLKTILQVIVAIIPFVGVIVLPVTGIVFGVIIYKRKKNNNKPKE